MASAAIELVAREGERDLRLCYKIGRNYVLCPSWSEETTLTVQEEESKFWP